MTTSSEVEMSASAVDAFLGRHETGVLSLARDDSPYAIPVSYGYDEASREAFLRLVSAADGEKRAFLASDPEARLVVHDEAERVYTSAIAVGTLERVDPETLTAETIAQYGETRRPLFEMWADGKPDLDIELYRLAPERLTGRKITVETE
ncbi:MAG: putative flavin-nucleotide-binding protein [uncultured archaeon A07HR67]|nr:MAG: putative flavin-nucleotide-binding protein [uncultured archaeon A07HR67]